MFNNDKQNNKGTSTAINFDTDWRYVRLTNTASYDHEFISPTYDDHDWKTIQLPHYDDKKTHKFTSTCVSYWYRKRFDSRAKYDIHQHIYLHFDSMSDDNNNSTDSQMKIPAVTIWLNEKELFSGTLPEPIDLTKYLNSDAENFLVMYSKHGYRLRLHACLLLPRHLSGQIDFDELHEDKYTTERGKTLDYEAGFDDSEGLINLFINKFKKKDKKYDANNDHDANKDSDDEKEQSTDIPNDANVEVKTIINGPIPRLAIVMLIVGTRGDVQPFIAHSKALLACGHRVRLATHETFRKFVRENGIEYYPLAGDPADLMSFMVKNAGIVPSVSSIVAGDIAKSRRLIAGILASTWKACIENDDETGVSFAAEVIIANPPSYGHIHCAQKLQIPLHIVFTMPWSPTIQFPHPFCKVDYNRAPIDRINMLSYDLIEVLTWSGIRTVINEFRKDILGLPTMHTRQAVHLMIDERVPHTYCWSPSLVPKPADWGAYIDVSGFFFLDLATNYKPPKDILEFLKAGEPPIYIGFGSITGHDSQRILHAVLEALKTTGYRALLCGFKVDDDKLPDNVLKIDNCPHDWLFQHVVAVCHHGGAGTTAAGLRFGKPTIIVPFFGDQFFWGSMVSKSGAGPPPMPGKSVTAKQFAAAFEFIHDPKTQEAALKISTSFQNEHGCEVAVQSFHANLPLSKMRSDLEPSFSACFRLNEYDLQISRPVAQVLVAGEAIEESELSPHPTYGWCTLIKGEHINVITRGFRRAVSKITDSVHRLKRTKSMNNLERQRSRSAHDVSKRETKSIGEPFKDSLALYGEVKERPEEEQNGKTSKREQKVKHSVHYGLATLVEKPPLYNRRHSTAAAGASSPAVNSPRKNLLKSRIYNNLSRSPYNQTKIKSNPQTITKTQRSLLTKEKSLFQSKKEKAGNKTPEEKAADMSGLSIDVCKQILADFKQMKHDRNHSNDNEKATHRIKIPHGLHRPRSRSSATH